MRKTSELNEAKRNLLRLLIQKEEYTDDEVSIMYLLSRDTYVQDHLKKCKLEEGDN